MKVNALAPMRLIRGLAPKMCDRGEVGGWWCWLPTGLTVGVPGVLRERHPVPHVAITRHCILRQLAG